MTDLPLVCRCGTVCGVLQGVAPSTGTHIVCFCRDCRAYARHLGDDAILDAAGGTELFQTSAGRLRVETGVDRVACLRMTGRGPVRWYATCCGSALANTPPMAAIPFAGVIAARLGGDRQALGPVIAQVFAEAAEPAGSKPPRKFGLATVALRFVRITAAGRLAGDHRRHPFFPGGQPLAPPVLLTAEESRAAYR